MNRYLEKLVSSTQETSPGTPRKHDFPGGAATRQAGREAAHRALAGARLVFVSRETLEKLTRLFGATPSPRTLRHLIEEIATGHLAVVKRGPVAKWNEGNEGNAAKLNGGDGPFYTVKQAAKLFDVSPFAIIRRCADGRISATDIGKAKRRYYRISEGEIERLRRIGLD
jgi:hypothetical protein